MTTLETSDYIAFFNDPVTIRRSLFWFFKLYICSQKIYGYHLYVMHCFSYSKYMKYCESLIDITTISITSNDGSEITYDVSLNDVAQSWGLLSILFFKA